MGRYWQDHYNDGADLFKESLLKQVGKTVNGAEVDQQQLELIVNGVVDSLHLEDTDFVVDLCCGNGVLTKYIAARAHAIVGVDFSDKLIDVARAKSSAANISYIVSDVLHLQDALLARASKYYMYEGLQYFSSEMLGQLLSMMKVQTSSRPVAIYIGGIPDLDRIWNYYDSEEKKQFYRKSILENKPHIGNWWTKSELQSVATRYGFRAKFLSQHSQLYTSYYRFDCLLESGL